MRKEREQKKEGIIFNGRRASVRRAGSKGDDKRKLT
jgi:hypothetical protein